MKILHTAQFYEPSKGGVQEVVKQLSEKLADMGHEVTVATTALPERNFKEINGVKIVEFQISGNYAEGYTGDTQSYIDFLLDSDFDIVTNFAAQEWSCDLALPILSRIKGKKVFVPTGFSKINSPIYEEYFGKMKKWIKGYDMNVFLSQDYQDIEFARKDKVKNICVIPNGASSDEFLASYGGNIRKELRIPEKDFLIITVGSHTGLKGHDEAIKIFKKVNIKNATFVIIGNSFSFICKTKCQLQSFFSRLNRFLIAKNKKILSLDLPRKKVVAMYQAADLFLFPSNIECSPIVLFECAASKTPFLSTDAGNASEIVNWTQSGQILPTITRGDLVYANIDKSVPLLEEMYYNSEKREKMASMGYEAWKGNFSWEKIAVKYEKLYKNLLESK